MASIREYFDADFEYAAKISLLVPLTNKIEAKLLCDYSGLMAYLICYVPGDKCPLSEFIQLIEIFRYGETKLNFAGNIQLLDRAAITVARVIADHAVHESLAREPL